jgi:hypothetical protein
MWMSDLESLGADDATLSGFWGVILVADDTDKLIGQTGFL